MEDNITEEIKSLCQILINSGFFSNNEVLEILEEQFIDEDDFDFSKIKITSNGSSNTNFSRLEDAFIELSKKGIISIHNCGYDIEDGVRDAFELLVHLKNNKHDAIGFCFYTFEDIEEAIQNNKLKITFGDFEQNESKALEIGFIIKNTLELFNFNILWNESIDEQIEINPFQWDKKFDPNKDYEMEGAFEVYIKNKV